MVEEAVPDRLVLAALDEILSWEELARSPSLQRFLRYVVEANLEGRTEQIKAYSIAVDVFDRSTDFDPQTDPIVRVQAGRLRKLLSRFYTYGFNSIPVRISLPVGSYVPVASFAKIGKNPAEANASADEAAAIPRASSLLMEVRRWRVAAVLVAGLLVVLAGSVVVFRPHIVTSAGRVPEKPRLFVDEFVNLTGVADTFQPVADIGQHIATDLSRFDLVTVQSADTTGQASGISILPSDFQLSGIVRGSSEGTEFIAFLTRGDSDDVLWSTTVIPEAGFFPFGVVNQATLAIAGRLGDYRGPLHAEARGWIDLFPEPSAISTPYLCLMRFYTARDTGDAGMMDSAMICADDLLKRQTDSVISLAIALAIKSGISAMQIARSLPVDQVLEVALFDSVQNARRATELAPDISFVHEQLGRVLALSRNYADARTAFQKALSLNPANMEIKANIARMLLATGDFAMARGLADKVLAEFSASAPWYHIVPMLDDFRNEDYEDALFGATTVMEGEPEIGLVVAVAAGALASRSDISQRYLPELLASPVLQETGIMPWVELRYGDEDLLNRLRLGLQLAGVPLAARDHPFTQPLDENEVAEAQ